MAAVEGIPDPRVAGPVAAYFDSITGGAQAAWAALFADDAVVHDPVGSVPAEGRGALDEIWKMLHVSFEKLEITAVHTFYGGNGAAVKWTACGLASTGREQEFEGISIFEVNEGGKIQTLMSYWDPAAMLIALAEGN